MSRFHLLMPRDVIVVYLTCQNNWEPQNEEQAAPTQDQSPTDTTELVEVSQQSPSREESGGRTEVSVSGLGPPDGGNTTQPQDEVMSVESISRRNSADCTHLPTMAKVQISI